MDVDSFDDEYSTPSACWRVDWLSSSQILVAGGKILMSYPRDVGILLICAQFMSLTLSEGFLVRNCSLLRYAEGPELHHMYRGA